MYMFILIQYTSAESDTNILKHTVYNHTLESKSALKGLND